jgi:hypothetical protein
MRLLAAITDGPLVRGRPFEIEVGSQGEAVDEALPNLKEALECYFEDAQLASRSHRLSREMGGSTATKQGARAASRG